MPIKAKVEPMSGMTSPKMGAFIVMALTGAASTVKTLSVKQSFRKLVLIKKLHFGQARETADYAAIPALAWTHHLSGGGSAGCMPSASN